MQISDIKVFYKKGSKSHLPNQIVKTLESLSAYVIENDPGLEQYGKEIS